MNKKKHQIGYLGPIGTFTEIAVNQIFQESDVEIVPYGSLEECILSTYKRETDYAVVPIENSIGGSVSVTLDWLIHEIDIPIKGEVRIPIHQHLLVHPVNHSKKAFTKVFSHPQAIRQCKNYLKEHYRGIEICYTESTAEAASILHQNPDEPWLAIANAIAKEIYALTPIAEEIEDYPTNTTRFVVLGYEDLEINSNVEKSSILLTLPKGAALELHHVLECFASRDLELTKIETAPTKNELGEYYYFLDFLTPGKTKRLAFYECCEEIEEGGCSLRSMGSYPCLSDVKVKI